jgi:transcriptional regulator with XRE-family HTH domain
MTPGRWLRDRRIARGLAQLQAADRAGICQGTWSQLERDIHRARRVCPHRIAVALGEHPAAYKLRLIEASA